MGWFFLYDGAFYMMVLFYVLVLFYMMVFFLCEDGHFPISQV